MNKTLFLVLLLVVGSVMSAPCWFVEDLEDCPTPQCIWEQSTTTCYNSSTCGTSLQLLDGHSFTTPPVLSAAISKLTPGSIDVTISLDQTRPIRTAYSAEFVMMNGTVIETAPLFDTTNLWSVNECEVFDDVTFGIADLILNASPVVTMTPLKYTFTWWISVSWSEPVSLSRAYTRSMESMLSFKLSVNRTVTLASNITISNVNFPNILWAYVSKTTVSLTDTNVQFYIEIVTGTNNASFMIIPDSMYVLSYGGHISSIVDVAFIQNMTDEGEQLWGFTVNLDITSGICSTTIADTFTLQYTIEWDPIPLNQKNGTLKMDLSGLEDWCSTDVIADISGQLYTFLDAGHVKSSNFFYTDQIVYLMAQVETESGLTIDLTTIDKITLDGTALTIAKPADIYIYTPLTTMAQFNPQIIPCPVITGDTVCAQFFLNILDIAGGNPLTISMDLTIDITEAGGKRRTESVTKISSTSFSKSVRVLSRHASDPKVNDKAQPTVVVVKSLTSNLPAILLVALCSFIGGLISFFIFVR